MQVYVAIEQHLSIMLRASYITTSFACDELIFMENLFDISSLLWSSWKVLKSSVAICISENSHSVNVVLRQHSKLYLL